MRPVIPSLLRNAARSPPRRPWAHVLAIPRIGAGLCTIAAPVRAQLIPPRSPTLQRLFSSSSKTSNAALAAPFARVESHSSAPPPPPPALTTPAVANWLSISSGLVFFIIVIGGVTRLTESGLSITEWEPVKGILPPIGDEQWAVEWEKYRVTPEGMMMNSQLDMDSFKRIFYMEWAHRLAGRVLGVGFILPAAYFLLKGKVAPGTRWKLAAIAGGIGFQGALGWYMVKSGLDEENFTHAGAVPRVSQYRLAAHLGAALMLYTGMVHTANTIKRDWKYATGGENTRIAGVTGSERLWNVLQHPSVKRFGKWSTVVGGMVLFTAISGAFVAGLDAGLIYNEFPTMGGRLMPPVEEMMDPRYAKAADKSDTWWRNLLENPTTVQFDHRALAITTFTAVLSLPLLATRPALRRCLPPTTLTWAKTAAAAAILQVTMGVTTLLYLVPVPLAAAHQAGSVLLLTTMLGLAGTMRRPSALARAYRAARQSSMQAQGGASVKAGQQAGFAGNVEGVLRNVDSSLKARVNTP
ncbi:hypothetical protein QFC21_000197 [Naganishia friedmannii]|uniref:Uncharacterized protein n=1 Tax=Naganishia friedmannii TaxID=89922 RepID=A0ACC2WB59_9TREE|nr:hypothetical protein QFC21_000197 [Naganishia friedmannii]